MDDIIGMIVFSLFMVGVVLVKIINKAMNVPDHTPHYDQKEAFPSIETLAPAQKINTPQKMKLPKSAYRPIEINKQDTEKGTAHLDIKKSADTHPLYIRLDNPNEARRAFIYSEIFNRKYT